MIQFLQEAAHVVPSKRQLDWYELESYAFIHFGVNTFTNREWGEEPSRNLFLILKSGLRSVVEAIKAAGMKGMVLTAKHHDGFCLWPSKYTEHSVKNSPCKKTLSGKLPKHVKGAASSSDFICLRGIGTLPATGHRNITTISATS